MLSTCLRHFLSVSLALIVSTAWAGQSVPRILEEPAFGMRYETATVKFDILPADTLSHCWTVSNDTPRVRHLYGMARDTSGNVYYAVDGDYYGSTVFQIRGKECTVRGMVDNIFRSDAPILAQLAADIASRYVRAFGADRLRTELRNQRVEPERLPVELRQAFRQYLPRPRYVLNNDTPLQVLRDPILGLRYEASAKFDPLPNYARDACGEWIGHDRFTIAHFRVYAQAHDAGGTYFVTGGHFEMRPTMHSSFERYILDQSGEVIQVKGTECITYAIRHTRDVFRHPDIPPAISRQLAIDFSARLIKAFGRDRVRLELRRQHVDWDGLSPGLRTTLEPYSKD